MPNLARLKCNHPAPDLSVLEVGGHAMQLSSLWKKRRLAPAFTRQFGCPQCKEMMDESHTARPELEKRGLTLAILTQRTPDQAKA